MAKVCEVCGKSTGYGRRIRHHHAEGWRFRAPRSSRTWKPSLRSAKVMVDGAMKKVKVCMKCYKTINKNKKSV